MFTKYEYLSIKIEKTYFNLSSKFIQQQYF